MRSARAVRGAIQQDFIKKFESLSGRYSVRQIWEDWVIMAAISISNVVDHVHAPEREKHYMTIASKYSRKEMEVFAELMCDFVNALESNPDQDFLGEMYMAVGMGNENAGQFFTPYCVCKMMAKITNTDVLQEQIERRGWVSVMDPACGAGALLVAFAAVCRELDINYQTKVLFVAQDIDYLVGCMCYLQLSLLGCPGYVVIGDSIAHPTTSHDPHGLLPCDDGNVWYTPFYFREEWHVRRTAAQLALAFSALGVTPGVKEVDAVTDPTPVQALPEPEPMPPAVTPNPEPESPVEAVETVFAENEYGQLTLF